MRLDESQHAKLSRYLDLLLAANAKMNLTRITDRAEAQRLHVADSLTLLPFLPAGEHRLVDVGSGGGVPGIVLAIARPDAKVVLLEATKKKADFLRRAAAELQLDNVTVDARRAEDAGRGELRESFDVAVARAVGTMVWLVEWMLPLVKKGGQILAMKGKKAQDELAGLGRAIRVLGGGPAAIQPADLPGAEHHVIVRIDKIGRSDARYPRAAPAAKGKPMTA
ncbi:MAG: 16S rRNA (guanine(527)-N(7))-methyltransferase RsmG [Tepidisphaeraceae bacterium]